VPTPVPLENFEHLPVVTSDPYTYGSSALTEAANAADPAVMPIEPNPAK
jgi:hypothetical protein